MVCCTLVAASFAWLGTLVAIRRKGSPLAWRIGAGTPSGPNSLRERARSFGYAFAGLGALVRHEANARIHLAVAVAVVACATVLGLSAADWRWIIFSVALVFAAEAFNTAIERVCDVAHPDPHPLIGMAKDVAAGAVLVSALAAATIGGLTFYPYVAEAAGLPPTVRACSHS